MHIAMHMKSTKSLPTHNVIYSIVQRYLKKDTIYRRFLFKLSVIVRLFPRRFFHGPTVVNSMTRFIGGSFLGHR